MNTTTSQAITPDTALLLREALAARLTDCGFRITARTLANLAAKREGPPHAIWNGRAVYELEPALAWARSRLQQPRSRALAA